MNSPCMPSVRTREKSCRSPPCQATYMPFGNEMRGHRRFWRGTSRVMWSTPPDETEVSVRFAKIIDPGQQRCVGVRINVQKFEAHSHRRFLHADHYDNLFFFTFHRHRSPVAGADLPRLYRHTYTTSQIRYSGP